MGPFAGFCSTYKIATRRRFTNEKVFLELGATDAAERALNDKRSLWANNLRVLLSRKKQTATDPTQCLIRRRQPWLLCYSLTD